MIPEALERLIGQSYTFEDGNTITIKEVKRGDENYHWITYVTVRGGGLPQQFKMEFMEFNNTFGHLFQ